MGQQVSFSFAQMGTANYAEVGKWLELFPQEFKNKLNRSEEKTLKWLLFFTWHSAVHSGRNHGYASFSQQKTGQKFGRSRWTVARALDKLEWMGLITRLRRRPKPGQVYQTNLYFLTSRLLSMLTACLTQVRKKTPCSKTAPQVFPKRLESAPLPLERGGALEKEVPHDNDDPGGASSLAFLERVRAFKRPG